MLIPMSIVSPIAVFNARILASLVTVAGNALSRCLTVILNVLVKVLEEDKDEELRALLGWYAYPVLWCILFLT